MNRAAGWRVPSVTISLSALPDAWIDASPVRSTGATSTVDAASDQHEAPDVQADELAEFGRSEAMIRRWRGWSFRRRNRATEPDVSDAPADLDLDLVALAAEDDLLLAGDEHVWTDLTLAALEDTGADDAWTPGPDPSGAEAADTSDGPWATLAEELPEGELDFVDLAHEDPAHDDRAHDTTPSTTLELEEEFWARGTR